MHNQTKDWGLLTYPLRVYINAVERAYVVAGNAAVTLAFAVPAPIAQNTIAQRQNKKQAHANIATLHHKDPVTGALTVTDAVLQAMAAAENAHNVGMVGNAIFYSVPESIAAQYAENAQKPAENAPKTESQPEAPQSAEDAPQAPKKRRKKKAEE